jgi:deoxyribodipyrimidine photo-lyase
MKQNDMKINIFWFRRDLRLDDNTALTHALRAGLPVLPVFIFDTLIIDELPADDSRISFIYESLVKLNDQLQKYKSSLLLLKGEPGPVWQKLMNTYNIGSVFINKDYEPYAIARDLKIKSILGKKGIVLRSYKDQVIYEEREILKSDLKPYTLFTPYSNSWRRKYSADGADCLSPVEIPEPDYLKENHPMPSLQELGFIKSPRKVKSYNLSVIKTYDKYRDYPSAEGTTFLGPHLRFGTVSIRDLVRRAVKENAVFLNELIWREFFMQILFNFPYVVTGNFRSKYDNVPWRNDENEFEKWCKGLTGYPMVDAGMRELNETGYMHNRVRMITAGFLCKHLLIDWRWGEAYFAEKLLDYELSSNNGNWQWAAGTGCDAAQYFRVFNPASQQLRFDRDRKYIKQWIKEIDTTRYPAPMVDHEFARKRVLEAYKSSLE